MCINLIHLFFRLKKNRSFEHFNVNDDQKCVKPSILDANSDKTPITKPNKQTAPLKTLYNSQINGKMVDH